MYHSEWGGCENCEGERYPRSQVDCSVNLAYGDCVSGCGPGVCRPAASFPVLHPETAAATIKINRTFLIVKKLRFILIPERHQPK
jgi:hypothetical protein